MPPAVVPGPSTAKREKVRVLITGFGPFRQTLHNPSWECAIHVSDHLTSHRKEDVVCDRAFMPTEYAAVIDRVPALHGIVSPPADLWRSRDWRQRDVYTTQFAQETWHRRLAEDSAKPYDLMVHVGQGLYDSIAIETVAHRRGCKALDNAGLLPPIQPVVHEATPEYEKKAAAAPQHEQVLTAREVEETTDHGYTLRQEHSTDPTFEVLHGQIDADDMIDRIQAHLARLPTIPEPTDTEVSGGVGRSKTIAIRKSVSAGRFLCEFLYYASLAEVEQRRRREGDGVRTKCVFIHIPPYDDRLIGIEDSVDVVRTYVELAIEDILATIR